MSVIKGCETGWFPSFHSQYHLQEASFWGYINFHSREGLLAEHGWTSCNKMACKMFYLFSVGSISKLLKVIMYDLMFVLMVFNTWYWTIRDQETKVSLRQILWPLLDCIRRHHNMNTDDIHQSIWSRILWSSLRLKLFKCNQSRPGAEQIIQLHKTHWPDPPWYSENYFCFLTWKIFDTLVKCYGTRPIHCVN